MTISIRSRCLPFILVAITLPSLGSADTTCQLTLPADDHGRERTMEIYGTAHEVTRPRDAATGLPTGKRQHSPFVVVKAVDSSSAGLREALISGAPLSGPVVVECAWKTSGSEDQFYTIELINATVSSIRTESLAEARPIDSLAKSPVMLEEVELAYEAIEHRFYEQGGHMTVVEDYAAE